MRINVKTKEEKIASVRHHMANNGSKFAGIEYRTKRGLRTTLNTHGIVRVCKNGALTFRDRNRGFRTLNLERVISLTVQGEKLEYKWR